MLEFPYFFALCLRPRITLIDIDDRIVLSGRFDGDNFPALGSILSGLGVGQAQFFVNSANTRTE